MSSKIDWPIMPHTKRFDSWNPVMGCQHGCSYCYAERMNKRWGFIPDFREPRIFPRKIFIPYTRRVPTTFFVCSMADLFGEWVPSDWINQIICAADANIRRHGFMFLTKNPRRYVEFKFPPNCMLGTSIATRADLKRIDHLALRCANKTFISLEPLMDDFTGVDLPVDLVIVGGMTGPGAIKPKPEWLDIRHDNVWFKRNCGGNGKGVRA